MIITEDNNNRRIYVNTFLSQAQKIKDLGLPLNKKFMENFKVLDTAYEYACKYLEEDVNLLVNSKKELDLRATRGYIYEKLGKKTLNVFRTNDGEVKFDIQHCLVALAKEKATNSHYERVNTLLGISYLVLGNQLNEEWRRMVKSSKGGKIEPNFDCSQTTFTWKRCPEVLRKYALYLTKPEGYDAYYFEKQNIGQIAYLISTGKSLEEAIEYMQTTETGLFFNFLPKNKENIILSDILTNNFYGCNGLYTSTLERTNLKLETQYSETSIYNVYNLNTKPHMIEIMGFVLKGILDEMEGIKAEGVISNSDAYVYHVSPNRIGIAVRSGLNLSEVLPTFCENMKPVQAPDLASLVSGEYL